MGIDAATLRRRLDSGERITLLDVRSAAEFEAGRLAGSLHVPLERLASSRAAIPAGLPIVVVCQSGTRSKLAVPALADRPGVEVLDGGLAAWRKLGFPMEGRGAGVWPLERQVRLVAGTIALLGSLAAVFIHIGFVSIPIFIGAGLAFSGLTGFCGMAVLLAKLPFNRRAFGMAAPGSAPGAAAAGEGSCGAPPDGGCSA